MTRMRESAERIFRIVWKEVLQIRRDRRMFGLLLFMPVMQLLIFGYVVATDVDDIDLAVCDFSRSTESRAYVAQLEQSGYFRVRAECRRIGDVDALLDRGVVRVALAIPPDFAERLKRREPAQVDRGSRRSTVDRTPASTERSRPSGGSGRSSSYSPPPRSGNPPAGRQGSPAPSGGNSSRGGTSRSGRR